MKNKKNLSHQSLFPFLIFLFVCNLLSSNLKSQEQVSDVYFKSLTAPTDIQSNVGFALHNGVQYLIEEKGSLIISKFIGSDLVLHSTIENEKGWARIFSYVSPNRSLFEIREQLYYRFSREGIEIINLETGQIINEFDVSKSNIIFYYPVEIFQNNLYFYGIANNQQLLYKLNMISGTIALINAPKSRTRQVFYTNKVIGLEENRRLYFYNVDSDTDSLIYESNNAILFLNKSVQDSTIWFVDSEGQIFTINNNLQIEPSNCLINNPDKLYTVNISKNQAIAIYKNNNNSSLIDYKVDIHDLSNCNLEISFTTDPIDSYNAGVSFVRNETNDNPYTIFGFYGGNPTDGFNDGLFYVIDHGRRKFTPINHISSVLSFTPFIKNDNIYCIGEYSSFWGASQGFVKYNINNQKIEMFGPNPTSNPLNAKLGFPIGEGLVACTNFHKEDPTIWKLDVSNNFFELQNLDFYINLGVDKVVNSIVKNDKIYFITNGGLYSVKDYSEEKILFKNNLEAPNNLYQLPIASYQDKLAIPIPNEQLTKIKILDIKNNKIDSLIDSSVLFHNSVLSSGPFLFYSRGNAQDTLKAYDLKTNSILKFPEIPYIIDSWLLRGKEKTVFFNTQNGNIVRIDNVTNSKEKFYLPFGHYVTAAKGIDNSFYIYNRKSSPLKNNLIRLNKNGVFQTIYEGNTSLLGSIYNDKNFDIVCLETFNDSIIILAIGTDKIDTTEIVLSGSKGASILLYKEGKLLLKTSEESTIKYYIYRPLQPIEPIDIPNFDRFIFSDFKDDSTLILFLSIGNEIGYYKYNLNTHTSFFQLIENNGCDYSFFRNGIIINPDSYLFNLSCDYDYEPWLFDMKDLKFIQLKDMNPGFLSSYPENFIKLDNWIYFTAKKKDGSTQWFRISTSEPSKLEEIDNNLNYTISIYPVPAVNEISIKENLEEITIYNINGSKVLTRSNIISNEKIDISILTQGTYLVSGKSNNGETVIGRFIKQ